MANRLISRVCGALMLSASLLALSACTEVEYVADRTQQGASDVYDSLFSSKTPPKTTTTKVDVSVPPAAAYQDTKSTTANPNDAVVLGAMRDNNDMLPPPSDGDESARSVDLKPASSAAMSQPVADAVTITNENLGAPLMVIRFNQNHVYYDQALTKVVMAAEKTKPGMRYNIVSRLPDLSSLTREQQENINSRANDNLHNVVTQMQQMGVPGNRIKIANQRQDVRSQEIAVYVN